MEIELNYEMEAAERIKLEIEASDGNEKVIGEYLLNQFANDKMLENAYKERKITLSKINEFVTESAKKMLNSKNGFVDDKVVYGWVLHYVQDEKVDIPEAETYKLTKEDKEKAKNQAIEQFKNEELNKIRKAEERKKQAEIRKIEKDKKEMEESGQLSLFDL